MPYRDRQAEQFERNRRGYSRDRQWEQYQNQQNRGAGGGVPSSQSGRITPPPGGGVVGPMPPPSVPVEQVPAPGAQAPINENAFYDAALARRARALAATADSQRNQAFITSDSRGLGRSGAIPLLADINRQEGLGLQEASSDIFGQQFMSQQQQASESRAFERQKALQDLEFQQQVALLKLQKKLAQKKGGFWNSLARGLGGAAAGFLTGGPAGAVVGGVGGFTSE